MECRFPFTWTIILISKLLNESNYVVEDNTTGYFQKLPAKDFLDSTTDKGFELQ